MALKLQQESEGRAMILDEAVKPEASDIQNTSASEKPTGTKPEKPPRFGKR